MPDDWYYAQKNQRLGPVSFAKLKAMADSGWLAPDDFVWRAGMGEWIPARNAEGLFANPLGTVLTKTIAGLSVEIGGLLGQAIGNIGKASKEAADRRLRAKELALEKRKRDLEAARLAQEQAARAAAAASPATVAGPMADHEPSGAAGGGRVVVINHPPVQRWSPGLAAALSFFVPGLGQLYKGQILNGIVWFCLVGFGYLALILPGLILHFFCVLGALSGNPWTEGKTTVVRQ